MNRLLGGAGRHMRAAGSLVAVLLVLLLPGAALAAGSSTCNGYNPQTCSSVGSTSVSTGPSSTTANTSTAASTSGTLPFTGLDVALLVAGAAGLTGAGLVMRRLSRPKD